MTVFKLHKSGDRFFFFFKIDTANSNGNLVFAGSFPKSPNNQGWAKPKPEIRNSIFVSLVGSGNASTWAITGGSRMGSQDSN